MMLLLMKVITNNYSETFIKRPSSIRTFPSVRLIKGVRSIEGVSLIEVSLCHMYYFMAELVQGEKEHFDWFPDRSQTEFTDLCS